MKNILTTLTIALAIMITISSCGKEKNKGESMYGSYAGNVTDTLRIDFAPIITIDTNFTAPGIAATGSLSESAYTDSITVNVKLTVEGVLVEIDVLGFVDTESSFTVPKTIYSYLGNVDLLVSGSGKVSGDKANVDIQIAEPDGTTDKIFGDLKFEGNR